jgi:hypothetical protein
MHPCLCVALAAALLTPATAPDSQARAAPLTAVAAPREHADIPTPPGYAPRDPQPWVTGVRLMAAQYVAVLGVGNVLTWVQWVPLLGAVAQLLTPAAQGAAAVYAGDRLGPYRSPLVWPVATAYATTWGGLGVAAVLGAAGYAGLLVGVPLALAGFALPQPLGLVVSVVGGGISVVGGALLAVSVVASVLVQYLVVPAAVVAAYHLARKDKRPDDDGDGLPRILPGRGLPLPFIGPGRSGDDDDNGKRDRDDENPPLPVRGVAP